ncbi:MAG: hypothetical protein HRT80_00165 [Henriciella sp.]|nr:hypothetical protein [Henriciella sp.]
MTREKITIERALELIEAYGAEPGGWPEDERAAASALIEAEPNVFAEVLSEAHALDAVLMNEMLPEPSVDLAASILARAPVAAPERKNILGRLSSVLFPKGVRWPAGAALASLLMGLVGGYAYAASDVGYDQADAVYYAAFGVDSDESWLSLE